MSAADVSEADSLDEIEMMVKKKAQASGAQDDETVKALMAEMQAIRQLLAERPTDPSRPVTGIVFNTAKTDMKRVLFPKVYVESSDTSNYKLVYGDPSMDRPSAMVTSWSGWAQTVDEAKSNTKVLDNPIVIHNVQVNDGEAAIIKPEDAEMLNKLEKEHKFLANGKVVFLL